MKSAKRLLIEIFAIGLKLILPTHTTFPPGFEETTAVAQQLDEGRNDTQEAYPAAVVSLCGVEENEYTVEREWRKSQQTDRYTQCLLHTGRQGEVKNDAQKESNGQKGAAHRKHHG